MLFSLTLIILLAVVLTAAGTYRSNERFYASFSSAAELPVEWLQTRPRGKYHRFQPYFVQSDCGRVERTDNAVAAPFATSVVSDIRDDRKVSDRILVGRPTDQMCKNCIRAEEN